MATTLREWTDGVLGDGYDRSSTANTLSSYVIGDTLMRSELYREIRAAQTDPDVRGSGQWGAWSVSPDESLRPDLIAYRAYGADGLRWVVMVAASLDDSRERIEAGTTLWLPTAEWIHDRLRHYSSIEVRE